MAEVRRMRPLLGTFVEVGARGAWADSAVEAAFAAIERAQTLWSFHDLSSELSLLNSKPGEQIPLSDSSLRLLRAARALMRATDGAFDCTVGGALVRAGHLPDHGGPEPLLRGDADDIDLGRGWAQLRRPVRLTLDGIAKGFAVDLAIGALRHREAHAGWVNAGGDLRVFGDISMPVHRRELDGQCTDLGRLRDAAVASSAVLPGGAADASFPGRIIAPSAGTSSPGVWTVLARSAWRADALTKVAACTGSEQRAAAVARLGGCLVGAAS